MAAIAITCAHVFPLQAKLDSTKDFEGSRRYKFTSTARVILIALDEAWHGVQLWWHWWDETNSLTSRGGVFRVSRQAAAPHPALVDEYSRGISERDGRICRHDVWTPALLTANVCLSELMITIALPRLTAFDQAPTTVYQSIDYHQPAH